MRTPDQLVGQPERDDEIGGRRQQRHDPHDPCLPVVV
jgi:hypothetical protein